MAPAFSSAKQAAAFAFFLLLFLLLPLAADRRMLPSAEELYAAPSWAYGAFPYIHDQIFEEKGDIDIAFMGSSPLYWGIDTPYVEKKMSEMVGRPAVVRSLCWHWSGFDALYFTMRELLQHRKVHMIIFCDLRFPDASNAAHRASSKWFLWSKDEPDIAGMNMRAKMTFYAAALVGMPRNLLDLARRNLPAIPTEEVTFSTDLPRAKNPALRLGSLEVKVVNAGAFSDYTPPPPACSPQLCVYSESTKSRFRFGQQPVPATQAAFTRKIAALAGEYHVQLVYLHMPSVAERRSEAVEPTAFWPEIFGANVIMAGIPGDQLFGGIAEEDVTNKLFCGLTHLNKNGQKFLTPFVTPGLVQLYENQSNP